MEPGSAIWCGGRDYRFRTKSTSYRFQSITSEDSIHSLWRWTNWRKHARSAVHGLCTQKSKEGRVCMIMVFVLWLAFEANKLILRSDAPSTVNCEPSNGMCGKCFLIRKITSLSMGITDDGLSEESLVRNSSQQVNGIQLSLKISSFWFSSTLGDFPYFPARFEMPSAFWGRSTSSQYSLMNVQLTEAHS